LGIAAGYGADGMIGGTYNFWTDKDNVVHDRRDIVRFRQFYLSPDFNLSKIPVKNKTLKTVLFILNCIKLPAPAIEFSNQRFKFHALKF
jgi:hypothetical protein